MNKRGPVHPILKTRCWEWKGGSGHHFGYGAFSINGRTEAAHRVIFRNVVAPIPKGMCVLHKCDNPKCVRPEHLFLGTKADNNVDRDSKGRGRALKGSMNGIAKLTEDKVRRMRRLYRIPGVSQRMLAKEFNISQMNVFRILKGETWKHA